MFPDAGWYHMIAASECVVQTTFRSLTSTFGHPQIHEIHEGSLPRLQQIDRGAMEGICRQVCKELWADQHKDDLDFRQADADAIAAMTKPGLRLCV